ncbi:hypothetical protein AYO22_06655 [Fonsecaea multimorphosa]|nr:hypothetical protein AYO22_06655 [Fonsecaea multimorphosa]
MSQIILQEDKMARPAFLSRMFSSKGRFYRTLPPRAAVAVAVNSENSSMTLKTFISVFNSSQICRITLKNRLRQIIIQGASKAWNPSSCSISPRNLFKQDFKPADPASPASPASRLFSHASLPHSVTYSLHSVQISLSAFIKHLRHSFLSSQNVLQIQVRRLQEGEIRLLPRLRPERGRSQWLQRHCGGEALGRQA